MGKLVASGVGQLLDKITPYGWMARIVILALLAITALTLLNMVGCSRQEAAQSKQDARSAQAGTKTGKEALTTLEGAQERDKATDQIVADGKKGITDAETDVDADAAARAAICRMRNNRDQPACRLP